MSEIESKTSEAEQGMTTDAVKPTSFTGRSVFAVETVAAGIAVQTALLTEDNQVMLAPAVFPDVSYALQQIDELRQMVLDHFTRAAKVVPRCWPIRPRHPSRRTPRPDQCCCSNKCCTF